MKLRSLLAENGIGIGTLRSESLPKMKVSMKDIMKEQSMSTLDFKNILYYSYNVNRGDAFITPEDILYNDNGQPRWLDEKEVYDIWQQNSEDFDESSQYDPYQGMHANDSNEVYRGNEAKIKSIISKLQNTNI